jgi:hypothetical protein
VGNTAYIKEWLFGYPKEQIRFDEERALKAFGRKSRHAASAHDFSKFVKGGRCDGTRTSKSGH